MVAKKQNSMAKCITKVTTNQITKAKRSNDTLLQLVKKTCYPIIGKENEGIVDCLDIGILKSEQNDDNSYGINEKNRKRNENKLAWTNNKINVTESIPVLLATNEINRKMERVCGGAEANGVSEIQKEGYHHPPTDEHGHGSLHNFIWREESLRDLYAPSIKSNESRGISYEEWLTGKKRIFAERAAKNRQRKAMFERAAEQRRILAAQKYDEWLSDKIAKDCLTGEKSNNSMGSHPRDHLTQEEMEQRVQEWEYRKQREMEQKREEQRLEAEMNRERKKWRKIQSDAAWKKWLARADKRRNPMFDAHEYSSLSDNVPVMFSDAHGW